MDIVERLRHGAHGMDGVARQLEAATEIERLRAALKKIADPDISWGHMKKIARDALDQQEPK